MLTLHVRSHEHTKSQGYAVVCYLADVGQEDARDAAAIEKKALFLGAERMIIVDLQRAFIEQVVFRAVQCNAIFEDRYLLGTSLARPVIAKAQVQVAEQYNCEILSHGCVRELDGLFKDIAHLKVLDWQGQ